MPLLIQAFQARNFLPQTIHTLQICFVVFLAEYWHFLEQNLPEPLFFDLRVCATLLIKILPQRAHLRFTGFLELIPTHFREQNLPIRQGKV